MDLKTGLIVGFLGVATAAGAEQKTYDFQGFDQISVNSGVDVNIEISDAFSVRAEAHRGKLSRLDIEQSGDRLTIDRTASWGLWGTGKRDRFEVWITLPRAETIESLSGSSVKAKGLQGAGELLASSGASLQVTGRFEDAEISSQSGASLRVEGTFKDLVAKSSGGASMNLMGTCDDIEAKSSGGASLNAGDLACGKADGISSGGASLQLNASENAQLQASSGASLSLRGGAQIVSQETSGGASIRVR